jgi:cell cycle arrest protein BUB2
MYLSQNKSTTRLPLAADTVALAPAPSPEKSRTLRRLASHQHLSSNQPSLIAQSRLAQNPRPPLATRPSRDNLNQPTRARANSDLPVPLEKSKPNRKLPAYATHIRKSSLEVTLREGPGANVEESLAVLRHSVLSARVEAGKDGMSDYRIYLWLVLLNIPALPTDDYLELVHRGRSPAYDKIKNDTFRTLATDTLFKRRVTDASITRVLNSVAWQLHDAHKNEADSALYVQGMNVLSAPFLYASRSESEAFALFHTFITRECPGYIRGAMEGVHKGVALVDKCLAIINPSLANFLQSKNLPAKIYAFSSVLTFCACTPPLPEVLHLWDFLFAYGPHLNILCIVAQLLLLKDTLMASPR